jgi:pimeloyl-ACP methyl ester carboxylesterase
LTPKVLDLVVSGFDRFVAEKGAKIPLADRPILPLSFRSVLLAGVAILERSGPRRVRRIRGQVEAIERALHGEESVSGFVCQDQLATHSVRWDADSRRYQTLCNHEIVRAFRVPKFYSVDIWKYWEKIECPILVIWGVESDFLSSELAEEMQRRNPRTTVSGCWIDRLLAR